MPRPTALRGTRAPLLLLLAALALPGCALFADDTEEPAALVGEWVVRTVSGEPVVQGSRVTLVFGLDGRVGGDTSVNRYSAPYTLGAGTLELGALVSTRRAGPPELMAQEQRLLAALGRAERFEVTTTDGGVRLQLRDDAGELLVEALRG